MRIKFFDTSYVKKITDKIKRLKMNKEWTRQIRIYLSEEFSKVARNAPNSSEIKSLQNVLKKYDASIKCQYDAFAGYVDEAEKAISNVTGTAKEAAVRQQYFLYEWTKATIENPEKQAKYLKEFTVYVQGQETYDKDIADKLEAELMRLVDGSQITGVRNRDSNPVNNPQMPKKFRK